jgi:hypothetical protein
MSHTRLSSVPLNMLRSHQVPPLQQCAAPHQNTPPFSQLVPIPLTACSMSSSSFPPPSSQSTPSRRPTKSRLSQPSSTTRALQDSHCDPTLTHSRTRVENEAGPFYCFPFSKYQGKTLLDVPENYIAYLRIGQNMADSISGFAAVLRLFDEGPS